MAAANFDNRHQNDYHNLYSYSHPSHPQQHLLTSSSKSLGSSVLSFQSHASEVGDILRCGQSQVCKAPACSELSSDKLDQTGKPSRDLEADQSWFRTQFENHQQALAAAPNNSAVKMNGEDENTNILTLQLQNHNQNMSMKRDTNPGYQFDLTSGANDFTPLVKIQIQSESTLFCVSRVESCKKKISRTNPSPLQEL